jgi:hypothetical protein
MVLMSWVMVGTIAGVGDNGDVLVLGRAELLGKEDITMVEVVLAVTHFGPDRTSKPNHMIHLYCGERQQC